MATFVLNAVKSQLPMLVEKFEPVLEQSLRSSLKSMKAQHPEQVGIFFTNWTKLDAAVRSELGHTGGKRVKRTRKVHRKHRK